MPFPFFPFFRRKPAPAPIVARPEPTRPIGIFGVPVPAVAALVKRHFYNERGFQTYASFFSHWDGIITAGHVLTESQDKLPPFAGGPTRSWPGGLDAALLGCRLPASCPADPVPGQALTCIGFPAGSSHASVRAAKTYLERPGSDGTWIAHILTPDEPVVTGMSGGAVIDERTGAPIGIIITRNSPADLNNDRDPDESLDFISLAAVWRAVKQGDEFV